MMVPVVFNRAWAAGLSGQQRLACGSRAGGSTDPAGDSSAEICAYPLLQRGEKGSLFVLL